jgi:diguanylate cyclase (GGDEF)-like protein
VKKLWQKKEYIAVGIVILLFVFVSVLSLSSIRLLQGNARVVNFVGIVRGATQKLIKEEIMGWYLSKNGPSSADASDWYPDYDLVERLDSIVDELLTGEGPDCLVVLRDEDYLDDMRRVREHWAVLKNLIEEVRAGSAPDDLFDSSQIYFDLVNEAVFSAETYSEKQVDRINTILIGVNVIFVLLIVISIALYVRSITVKRRAEVLGRIAYADILTGLDNRTSCERLIGRIRKERRDADIAVFMFDMNDLKLTNDFMGHKGGDRVIREFARVLNEAAGDRGFVGRFGGDEFLVVFEPGDDAIASEFLSNVHRGVDDYNAARTSKLDRICFAAGYVIDNAALRDIEEIIHDADNRMYENKRWLKTKI